MSEASCGICAVAGEVNQVKLLIVDDDDGLRETLADFFEQEGYEVAAAATTAEARAVLTSFAADLLLLDINMPGGDGLTFGAELRARIATPIIFLSGKGSMVDRVVGLEIGADDYLAKPFELRELLARVRAVLRRTRPQTVEPSAKNEKVGRFSGLVFTPSLRRLATASGQIINLTGAEWKLFAALVDKANKVLTRDAIADLIRHEDWEAFDRSTDTLVSRLRRKLSTYVDSGQLIQTVRGEGYVLAADVKWSGPN